MTTPTFTPPPVAPSRSDPPLTFISRANAFLAWLVNFVPELLVGTAWFGTTASQVTAASTAATAAADAAVGSTAFAATSSNALNLVTGAQSLALTEAGKGFVVGEQIALILLSDSSVRMTANVSAFVAGTGAMDITVTDAPGAGTGTGWAILRKALEGLSPAEVRRVATSRAIVFAIALRR